MSKLFGPVMILWFGVLGIMGAAHILDDPRVIAAINPWHAAHFVLTHGKVAFITLGAVFLCDQARALNGVDGTEGMFQPLALYAFTVQE